MKRLLLSICRRCSTVVPMDDEWRKLIRPVWFEWIFFVIDPNRIAAGRRGHRRTGPPCWALLVKLIFTAVFTSFLPSFTYRNLVGAGGFSFVPSFSGWLLLILLLFKLYFSLSLLARWLIFSHFHWFISSIIFLLILTASFLKLDPVNLFEHEHFNLLLFDF